MSVTDKLFDKYLTGIVIKFTIIVVWITITQRKRKIVLESIE